MWLDTVHCLHAWTRACNTSKTSVLLIVCNERGADRKRERKREKAMSIPSMFKNPLGQRTIENLGTLLPWSYLGAWGNSCWSSRTECSVWTRSHWPFPDRRWDSVSIVSKVLRTRLGQRPSLPCFQHRRTLAVRKHPSSTLNTNRATRLLSYDPSSIQAWRHNWTRMIGVCFRCIAWWGWRRKSEYTSNIHLLWYLQNNECVIAYITWAQDRTHGPRTHGPRTEHTKHIFEFTFVVQH